MFIRKRCKEEGQWKHAGEEGQMTDGIWECEDRYLKFSYQSLELSVRLGTQRAAFKISTGNDEAKGGNLFIRYRMQSLTTDFSGREAVIEILLLTGNLE